MDQSRYAVAASSISSDTFRATPQDLYNDLGKTYEDAYANNEGQERSLQWLIAQLHEGASVLDLGCGTGKPAAKTLSDAGMAVTGVDISSVMLSHARASVPVASFIEDDILSFTPIDSPDAIMVYFSLIGHVSQDQIRKFFARVHSFLKTDGYFVFGTVPLDGDGVMTKWMGKEFPSSSLSTSNAVAEIKAAGFDVVKFEETMFTYARGHGADFSWGGEEFGEPHLFVYAQKGGK